MQFNEPSWIASEPKNHMVFSELQSFINRTSSDPTNVQNYADSTIFSLLSTSTHDPSVDQYRFESRVIFGILFTLVKQLNAAAVQQDHLVNLVTSLRQVQIPISAAQEIDPRALDSNMNEDLSKLINVWSSLERDAPLHPPLEDRPIFKDTPSEHPAWRQDPGHYLTAEEWANLNTFIARLHTAAPDVTKLDLRGLFALIEALEQRLTPQQLEDAVPAAACWIIYAGNELRNNNIPCAGYEDDSGCKRLPWSKGELWAGPHAFNQARWEFWMLRFKEIAEREDVTDTVKLAAWNALDEGSKL